MENSNEGNCTKQEKLQINAHIHAIVSFQFNLVSHENS